ncbi:MAG: WXG100 family type VII secretion target [Chloroflexota bacterium]|nr:WXG100 family type VII secretion target [Chloroflexota bacterium]
MSANIVQAKYDQLRSISESFHDERDEAKRIYAAVEAQLNATRHKWEAESATSFFRSMDNEVLIAHQRLIDALDHAGDAMLEIIQILQRAEQDAAARLPGALDGAGGFGGGGGLSGASGSFVDEVEAWIIRNRDTFKTINDYLGVIPFKETAAIVATIVGTPIAGAIVYAALFGTQTGFTFLERYGDNSGWRGVAIAAVDTGIGSVADLTGFKWMDRLDKLRDGLKLWDTIDQTNNWMQLIGNQGSGITSFFGETLGISPTLMQGLGQMSDLLGQFTQHVDLGDATYALSEGLVGGADWLIDQFSGSDPASVVSNTGFTGFDRISSALGVNPGTLDFNVNVRLTPPNVRSSLDELPLPLEARAALNERARLFGSYIADQPKSISDQDYILRITNNSPRGQ